jgi:hypothetical protein
LRKEPIVGEEIAPHIVKGRFGLEKKTVVFKYNKKKGKELGRNFIEPNENVISPRS